MGSEFLRIKSILDKIHETEEETRMICEVLRIKGILNNGGYKSEGVLCDLLSKLKHMVMSMKVLEVSMIGMSVTSLMKHASKDVRRIARMLVRAWRKMADEWVVVNDNDNMHVVQEEECGGSKPPMVPTRVMNGGHKVEVRKRKPKEPKLQRKKRLNMIVLEKRLTAMDRRKPSASVETMKWQKPTTSVVPVMSFDKKSVEEKLEATKRKLQEYYKDNKRQRKIQVIEMHDMLRLGLAPEHQDSKFGKHISHRVGSVRRSFNISYRTR